jgi:hypothetical protein
MHPNIVMRLRLQAMRNAYGIPNCCLVMCHDEYGHLFADVPRVKLPPFHNALKCILWDARAQQIIFVAEYRLRVDRSLTLIIDPKGERGVFLIYIVRDRDINGSLGTLRSNTPPTRKAPLIG